MPAFEQRPQYHCCSDAEVRGGYQEGQKDKSYSREIKLSGSRLGRLDFRVTGSRSSLLLRAGGQIV
jgi:hypothetical protein